MDAEKLPALTAAQAAARLGVKPATLYAYVSRGLLTRTRTAGGSLFDPLEVEAFARSRRPTSRPAADAADGHSPGTPLMAIDHDIALLEDDRLYFRGRPADELADSAGFETVAWWLWTRDWQPDRHFRPTVAGEAATHRVRRGLPAGMPLRLQLQAQVPVLAATDPLRHDLSAASVARMGAELIAGCVAALPLLSGRSSDASLAGRLWPRLADRPPAPADVELINAALVLLVDHDLAASTLAVRAAASARANPYAVVCCGLGALDSALHGNAGRAAYAMLGRVLAGQSAEQAIAASVIEFGTVPGFGHRVYRSADPRHEHLIQRLRSARPNDAAIAAADRLSAAVVTRMSTFPNVDFALATLSHTLGLVPDATEVIFALARCAGWLAHALAEYGEPPLRLRPEGRYTGP
jgi:citrate synthase